MGNDGLCVNCGRELALAAQFCGGCGRPVSTSGEPTMAISSVGSRFTNEPSWADGPTWVAGNDAIPIPDAIPEPGASDGRHRVLPYAIVAVAVAAIAVGAVVIVTGSKPAKHTSIRAVTPTVTTPIVMPFVLTFPWNQAVAQLERAGVRQKLITLKTKPREDVAPGTVLEQVPAAGITIAGRVTLTVSTAPAAMPRFVGTSINDARATLSTLDVAVTVQNQMNATVPDGTVVDQQPAPGAPFAKVVQLTVARAPIQTRLGDLEGVGNVPNQSESEIIGSTRYRDSLTWDANVCPSAPPVVVTYDLGGKYSEFVATAGLATETENAGAKVTLEIQVDGVAVFTRKLDEQSPIPVDLDVTGHQQLQLTFTPVTAHTHGCSHATAALGHPQLLSTS